jgi:hypothetical protein
MVINKDKAQVLVSNPATPVLYQDTLAIPGATAMIMHIIAVTTGQLLARTIKLNNTLQLLVLQHKQPLIMLT